MNIFFLDEDPVLCAQAMTGTHVVKMILESAQLLCTAHRVLDGFPFKEKGRQVTYLMVDETSEGIFYKSTHPSHPCAVWVRESDENYRWLYRHFLALCQEYTSRYNKIHKTEEKLGVLLQTLPSNIGKGIFTSPAVVMPRQYMVEGDVPRSYRNYYEAEKLKREEDVLRYREVLKPAHFKTIQ